MKFLLKLILLVILTSVCYSQGKIVSIETITRDFGEVTEEVVMSVTEFTSLINQINFQSRSYEMKSLNLKESVFSESATNAVGLKMVNGNLFFEQLFPISKINRGYEMKSAVLPAIGFKRFNVDMIYSLNSLGGESEIKIQNRSGELVLTNGDVSYNYVGY